jgi:hypothetical protein
MRVCVRADTQNDRAISADATIRIATVIGRVAVGMIGYAMMLPITVQNRSSWLVAPSPAPSSGRDGRMEIRARSF